MLITVTGSSTSAQPSTCGPIDDPEQDLEHDRRQPQAGERDGERRDERDDGDDGDRRERDHAAVVRSPAARRYSCNGDVALARLAAACRRHSQPTQWWPSVFGADDELGMLNHITDAKRLEALSLVREGRMYDLGRVLDEHVPVFPGRAFHQTLVTTAHHANMGGVGDNCVNWITEVFSGTTQLGTHLDALSHLQIGDRAYNGRRVDDIASPAGVTALGVETVPQIVTRGLLVDVSLARARPRAA